MEAVPIRRVFFWVFYVLGVLALAFVFLLSFVPRGIYDKDFRLEEGVWGGCACLQLATLICARKVFSGRASERDAPNWIYGLFSWLAFGELLLSLYALFRFVFR